MLQLGIFLLVSTAITAVVWWLGRPARLGLSLWRLWLQVAVLVALTWIVIAPVFVLAMAVVAIAGRLLVMPALVALGLMSPTVMARDNFALACLLGAVPLATVLLLVFRRQAWRGWRWVRVWWRRYRRHVRSAG